MTVLRWHNNPAPVLRTSGDCIEAHQYRVAMLCYAICARYGDTPSPELIRAALHHDEPERIMGDWPGPLTDQFPWLAPVKHRLHLECMTIMGIAPFRLTDHEAAVLDLADKADAWRWAVQHGAGGTQEWRAEKQKLFRMAWAAGLGDWWESFARGVDP
jgi:hypothetical protein